MLAIARAPGCNEDNLPQAMRALPSIFEAVKKQQLGFKLEAQKGPVDYYAVEYMEKPAN
jgi:uncharacterized protein (TIGR03435 family)